MVGKAPLRDKVKPLWIVLTHHWGGSEQVALSDISDLAQSGMTVTLLCLDGAPIHTEALRNPAIKVCPVANAPRGRFDWAFIRMLRNLIEETGSNIVHILNEKWLWILVPVLRGKPHVSIVASRHSMADRIHGSILKSILYRRLDYMIVLSESVKAGVLARRVVAEKKIKVINLGLDYTRFDPAKSAGGKMRKEWGADKDTIVIGAVGRMVPELGMSTFIKASAGLLKYAEWKMRFVVVGEDAGGHPHFLAELKQLSSQFHLDGVVVFAELSDNLPDVMSGFDIFVMPGSEEVPGLGALEALAMERPVVLSNVIGARDIVGDKEFGLLVRPDDAFDLQSKLLSLLKNPSLRLSMGQNGRQRVLKHFDKRTRFARTLDLYERCIKRRFTAHAK